MCKYYIYIHHKPTNYMKSRTLRKSSSSRKFRKSQKTCKSRQRGGYPKPKFCPACGSGPSYIQRQQGWNYGTDDWRCRWCDHEWTFNPDWTFKRASNRSSN